MRFRTRKAAALAAAAMCAGLLVSSGASMAEIYKWVDEDGNVHFSDSPPAQQEHEQVEVRDGSKTRSTTRSASSGASSDATGDAALAQRCNNAGRNLKRLAPQLQSMALSGAREANASAAEIAELRQGFTELNSTSIAEFSRECRRE